jgi:hypothetical protein
MLALTMSLILGVGCGDKPIPRETLDYFYGLVNQQYWQRQANGLALNDEYGTERLLLAQQGTSDREQYLVFGDVAVTSSSQKSGPTDAVIKVKVFDGTTEKEVRARVDETNRATLEKVLAETFESKAQRDQRLKGEAYAAKLKEANSLLAANKVADAISAFKDAQAINDTDEVKMRLDVIYLKQGKYYYGQKKYDVALERLRLVSFDQTSLKGAQELLPKVQADADKAAAEKAAAKAAKEKAAAEKAAAEKAAAEKAAAEKAEAQKAAAEKAAAEKAVAAKVAADAQRRTWYKTLNSYYESDLQAVSAALSAHAEWQALVLRIMNYCSSNIGMEPLELDQMRQELYSLVIIETSYINEILMNGESAMALRLVAQRNDHSSEFRRLRDLLASRYGH